MAVESIGIGEIVTEEIGIESTLAALIVIAVTGTEWMATEIAIRIGGGPLGEATKGMAAMIAIGPAIGETVIASGLPTEFVTTGDVEITTPFMEIGGALVCAVTIGDFGAIMPTATTGRTTGGRGRLARAWPRGSSLAGRDLTTGTTGRASTFTTIMAEST
jgi:hypothetical protein